MAIHFQALIFIAVLFCSSSVLGQTWDEVTEEVQRLESGSPIEFDQFGEHVAVYADEILVGVPREGAGSTYVFRFDEADDLWVEEQVLTASDGETADRFGESFDRHEDQIVVGAPNVATSPTSRYVGAAYIFSFDADLAEYVEDQKLTASDGSGSLVGGDSFGSAVAFFENAIAVSAYGSEALTGAIYIFVYDEVEESWLETQKITASDGASFDRMGWELTSTDDTLFAGALGVDDNGNTSGAVYVISYDSDEDEWLEVQKLTASDAATNDRFGVSVAAADDLLVVGSFFDDDNGTDSGSAYVFRYDEDEGSWVEEQKLIASDGTEEAWFGSAVAVHGSRIVVGAQHDDGEESSAGSSYVFEFDGDDEEWVETQKLIASDAAEEDLLGSATALYNDIAVVGAYASDSDETDSGAVYIYLVGKRFYRGDADGNGDVSALLDGLFILQWAFTDGDEPPCMDAADSDDSGEVSALLDALFLLNWAFSTGDDPPAPGVNECRADPTDDDVTCETPSDGCT